MSGRGDDPSRWLAAHGDAMFRFARMRLFNDADAEDAVQETLLAAIRSAAGFRGDSSERTWLVGILRHKVFDLARKRAREQAWRRTMEAELAPSPGDDKAGRSRQGAASFPHAAWPGPTGETEQVELRRALAEAIAALPPAMRQAFCLREIDELPTDRVCELLELSKTNLWTLIHRAKVRLRADLDRRWFEGRREST
jgi:RNA polymerase sigma-70 factor (ECF subfamily)